jgi:hypothetical protein
MVTILPLFNFEHKDVLTFIALLFLVLVQFGGENFLQEQQKHFKNALTYRNLLWGLTHLHDREKLQSSFFNPGRHYLL